MKGIILALLAFIAICLCAMGAAYHNGMFFVIGAALCFVLFFFSSG